MLQGPFDMAVIGEIDSLGNDLRAALLPISLLLKPGVGLLQHNMTSHLHDSSQR